MIPSMDSKDNVATGRVLIFSGGNLGEWAIDEVQPGDYLIGADRGAWFMVENELIPDLAIGDFDSVNKEELMQIQQSSQLFETCDPVLKDYTDTEMALRRALIHQPTEILLLGVLGTRLDHSLANVHLLVMCYEQNTRCHIIDAHNKVHVVGASRQLLIQQSRFSNVSILPLTQEVTGITLTGFQYPLSQASLRMGESLGISNILKEPTGTIEVASGLLLVIESSD